MRSILKLAACAASFSLGLCLAQPAAALPVFVPDNGFGTAHVPILADYAGETPMQIIDGLPAATTIDIIASLNTPSLYVEEAGGSLGGTRSGGGGTPVFTWVMNGTGALAGFNRIINMPVAGNVISFPSPPFIANDASFEVHTAPRMNGAAFQSFNTVMYRLFSQITGDPDFDLLRVVAGSDFGLPSPGHTTLLQNGPSWEVDSFFDITYRIDFVGKAGGPLSGQSGSTTGMVRFSLGDPIVPEPATAALVGVAMTLLGVIRCRRHA
jgi:hypothetical protein